MIVSHMYLFITNDPEYNNKNTLNVTGKYSLTFNADCVWIVTFQVICDK